MKFWDPADRSTENMGSHMLSAFTGIGGGLLLIIILSLFSSCQSYVDYINNTPVRTVTVDRPYYPSAYHSFYGAGGLGYYNNFYRPVYRPYRAQPLVRTRTVRPVRRVVKPQRPIRNVRPVRSGNRTVVRKNVGRRQ